MKFNFCCFSLSTVSSRSKQQRLEELPTYLQLLSYLKAAANASSSGGFSSISRRYINICQNNCHLHRTLQAWLL